MGPISLTIGGAAVILNFVSMYNSHKTNKKSKDLQKEYEKQVHNNAMKDSAETFKKMQKARKEMAENEREAAMDLQNEGHKEVLKTISYTSSLKKWPLFVPPLVMRNDMLLNANNNDTSQHIAPLNVIIGSFHAAGLPDAAYNAVQEQLFDFCSSFYNPLTHHPVIVYQGAWRDDKSSQVDINEIYSKLKGYPTLVITASKVGFEIWHWSDIPENPKMPYPIKLDKLQIKIDPNEGYEQISDQFKLVVALFSDMYMWHKAQAAPQIFSAIMGKGITVTDEELRELCDSYATMLRASVESGEVALALDTEKVLDFCAATDLMSGGTTAFSELRAAQRGIAGIEQHETYKPWFGKELTKKYINYCHEHKDVYCISDDELHSMETWWAEKVLQTAVEEEIGDASYAMKVPFSRFKKELNEEIIPNNYLVSLDYLKAQSEQWTKEVLNLLKPYPSKEKNMLQGLENLMKPWIEANVQDAVEQTHRHILNHTDYVAWEMTHNAAQRIFGEMKFLYVAEEEYDRIVDSAANHIKARLKSMMKAPQTKCDDKDYFDMRKKVEFWAFCVKSAWINVNIFSPDEIRSQISSIDAEIISRELKEVWESMVEIINVKAAHEMGEPLSYKYLCSD